MKRTSKTEYDIDGLLRRTTALLIYLSTSVGQTPKMRARLSIWADSSADKLVNLANVEQARLVKLGWKSPKSKRQREEAKAKLMAVLSSVQGVLTNIANAPPPPPADVDFGAEFGADLGKAEAK